MVAVVRQMGLTADDAGQYGNRLVIDSPTSEYVYVLVKDTNALVGAPGWGDGTGVEKYYLYRGDRDLDLVEPPFTLMCTVTSPGTSAFRIFLARYDDGGFGILHQSADKRTLRWCKISSAFVAGSWETISTLAAGQVYEAVDCDVAKNNQPIVAATFPSTDGNSYVLAWNKAATGGAWVQSFSYITGSSLNYRAALHSVSVVPTEANAAGTQRYAIIAAGSGRQGADDGCFIWTHRYTMTTGANVEVLARQTGIHIGDIPFATTAKAQERHLKLFHRDGLARWDLGIMQGTPPAYYYWSGLYSETGWTYLAQGSTPGRASAPGQAVDKTYTITNGFPYSFLNFTAIYTEPGSWNYIQNVCVAQPPQDDPDIYWHTHPMSRVDPGNEGYILWGTAGNVPKNGSSGPSHHMVAFEKTGPGIITAGGSTLRRAIYTSGRDEIETFLDYPTGIVPTSRPVIRVRARSTRKWPAGPIWPNVYVNDFSDDWDPPATSIHEAKYLENTQGNGGYGEWNLTYNSWGIPPNVYEFRAIMVGIGGTGYGNHVYQYPEIYHPPTAVLLSPIDNDSVSYNASGPLFRWRFTDTNPGCRQTAYQIVVERVDSGAVVADTGKVLMGEYGVTDYSVRVPLSASLNNIPLRWKMNLWDTYDTQSAGFSGYGFFIIGTSPIVTITSPANNGTVTSGIPSVTFQADTENARRIKYYTVSIFKGSTVVWTTGRQAVDVAENTAILAQASQTYLSNTTSYRVTVEVEDSVGIRGNATHNFTTSWTAPAAPSGVAVSTALYNVEQQGYISVTWSDTGRDAQFFSWVVYRKDDLIQPGTTTVLEEGTYKEVYRKFETASGYEFQDHFAPSGYKVNYLVKQVVSRFGDLVESTNTTPTSVFPYSEGYWLIEGTSGEGEAFRLSIVTGDSYTDEYEEADYRIIGRGRHFDQGEHYGFNGTLDAQIRDNGALIARQKRLRLEEIKAEARALYLRNPFGDCFRVAVKSMTFTRIAGVGASEFFDVTIPYMEVSE